VAIFGLGAVGLAVSIPFSPSLSRIFLPILLPKFYHLTLWFFVVVIRLLRGPGFLELQELLVLIYIQIDLN
jgi:hypothetical protein